MRASSLVLGPLVARYGSRPRFHAGRLCHRSPTDQSARGRRWSNWARIRQEHGYIEAEAPRGLKGDGCSFDRITVTGTEDVLMAAVSLAEKPFIKTPRANPKCRIWPRCSSKWERKSKAPAPPPYGFSGVARWMGREHTIIADRIEAGTFLIAGAMTRGELNIRAACPNTWRPLWSKCERPALIWRRPVADSLRVARVERLRAVDITTEEYPGFATDLQAQYMAMMSEAEGISFITETIFENRFMHAQELARMGANIRSRAARRLSPE